MDRPARTRPVRVYAFAPRKSLEQKREPDKPIPERRKEVFLADIIGDCELAPGMLKENTVWDVYNNEARKVDSELVKDWQSSLNFLLVFAAIFAAVLTAFIIESKKLLEQDQTKLLVSITMWNMNNMGNYSNLPYSPPDFEASYGALAINCLLFASLGASLLAALASVIALQWVADYDAAITRGGSSSEDRAKRRQFRFAGVEKWKMSEIIAALPILLYSSVILFWAGLIQWMWSIDQVVGYVVAGGTAIAISFYASTTFLAALYVSAPFRTPLSRGLYWTLQAPIKSIGKLDLLPRQPKWFFNLKIWVNSHSQDHKSMAWYWKIRALIRRFRRFRDSIPSFKSLNFVIKSIQWLRSYILPNTTSRSREDKAAQNDTTLEQQALIWLAYQLPVSADSHRRLGLLFTEVANNPQATLVTPKTLQDPWPTILDYFSRDCLRRVLATKNKEGRFDDVGVLLRFIERLTKDGKIRPSDKYITNPTHGSYWTQCDFTRESPDRMSENMAFLLSRDVPIPSINSTEELMTTTQLIRWRNLDIKEDAGVWMDILASPDIYSQGYLDSCRENLANFLTTLTKSCWRVKIPFSREPEKRRRQVIELFEVAALAMKKAPSEEVHRNLIWDICDGMVTRSEDWPCPSPCPDEVSQRVASIQDPCLAMIARFACGMPFSINPAMTDSYKSEYFKSVQRVQDFLYWDLSSCESAAIWSFRAAVFSMESVSTLQSFTSALYDPGKLHVLQRIIQNSTDCHRNLQEDCHILFHLFRCLPFLRNPRPDIVTSDDLRVATNNINPIILFLYFSSFDYLFYPFIDQREADPQSITGIWNACQAVKQRPDSVCTLLTEILVLDPRRNPCNLSTLALILDFIIEVVDLWESGYSVVVFRPLAYALAMLPERMQTRWGTEDLYPEVVEVKSKEVSRLLYTASVSILISSTSHLRMLLCVRASTSAQPAVGRLPMYIQL